MTTILTGATVDIINFIPWGFTLLSVLITIYTLVKKDTKDDSATTATVIAKLENIQRAVDKTGDMITVIQGELKNLDRRITKLETIEKMERALEHNE